MCHLITIGTRESREAILDLLGPDAPIAIHASHNPSVRTMFPQEDRLFELKAGPCSCALVPRTESEQSFDDQMRRRQERYRKEGWTDGKIARALDAARSAHVRAGQKHSAPEVAMSTLLDRLARKPVGVRLFIHFYSGSFDTEVVNSARVVRISTEQPRTPDIIAEEQPCEIVSPAD